jgi:hypothetical protein
MLPDCRVHACTLWSAAGNAVAGQGVLIAKNRDQTPASGELKIVTPAGSANRYPAVVYGTFASMGINEKGLALVSATAPDRDDSGGGGVNSVILSSYDSVDSVIAALSSFSGYHPQFFIIADKYKTVRVEIAESTVTPNVMDDLLLPSRAGRTFVARYYRTPPPVAAVIARRAAAA